MFSVSTMLCTQPACHVQTAGYCVGSQVSTGAFASIVYKENHKKLSGLSGAVRPTFNASEGFNKAAAYGPNEDVGTTW